MAKLYMNFRGKQGLETVGEYSTDELRPVDLEAERSRLRRPRLSAASAIRLIAARECAEANFGCPGHYISTRCTKAWRE